MINGSNVTVEPRGPLIGRGEIHKQQLVISKSAFKAYLNEIQVSAHEFEEATLKSNLLLRSDKQRLGSGWKNSMKTPPIPVYIFKTEFPAEIIDAAAQAPST